MTQIILTDYWPAILNDPALGRARNRLSMHEIRTIARHVAAAQTDNLAAYLRYHEGIERADDIVERFQGWQAAESERAVREKMAASTALDQEAR